ncbi:uncharacterized protein B0I36DRAFT_319970 [Microdochium trichocladiopsis]|uniref:Uncharacterized protein n=1 Tax=Microdochium trichocladiopsis TaxID=1682393 RepID=A0A9P8YAR0_9PEZI|nr:uncharacterized protein B0I36DRAFT_319970 [Microdochium trichocladiopsis]KAH7032752.1 hypothetical protein B0I36DRAFT_319970 [Microdochium trichocladiopsis]
MEQNKGLSASRWATGPGLLRPRRLASSRGSSPSEFSSTTDSPRDQDQLHSCDERHLSRFLKMAKRLKWKMPFLELGYAKATSRAGLSQQDIEENEINFKLDYYEYYILLEQALVSLLAVYGVAIDRHAAPTTTKKTRSPERSVEPPKPEYKHRYHANVISALESPLTPLGAIFGIDPVRKQLLRAKELRNRWKYIDDDDEPLYNQPPPPLESYNLDEILQTVQLAIEHGYEMAQRDVEDYQVRSRASGKLQPSSEPPSSQDWDFMVNAMEWEAI